MADHREVDKGTVGHMGHTEIDTWGQVHREGGHIGKAYTGKATADCYSREACSRAYTMMAWRGPLVAEPRDG